MEGIMFWLGGAAFMITWWIALTVWAFENGDVNYIQIAIGTLFFGSLGVTCLVAVFLCGITKFFNDRIEEFSLIRTRIRTIYLSDITRWEETIREDQSPLRFTIFYKNRTFVVDEDKENYQGIKALLTDNNPNGATEIAYGVPSKEEMARSAIGRRRFLAIASIVAGVAIIVSCIASYSEPEYDLRNLLLEKVAGTAAAAPDISKETGNEHVIIKIIEYPGVEFEISGTGYKATVADSISHIDAGDSVMMRIDAKEYKYKLSEETSRQIDKRRKESITVYSLRDNEFVYLSFKNIKKLSEQNNKRDTIVLVLLVAFILICWPFRILYKQYRKELNS